MDGTLVDPRRSSEETERLALPSRLDVAAEGADGDSLERALDLARALANRLARARIVAWKVDDLRLAQALSLNVVDLLEASVAR